LGIEKKESLCLREGGDAFLRGRPKGEDKRSEGEKKRNKGEGT